MHRHGAQSHPRRQPSPFAPDLVGLHRHQVQARLLDDRLGKLLAGLPGAISPACSRPLIQIKGMHNGLDRTPRRQQGDHDHNQLGWLAQSFEHGSFPCAKGLTTDPTAVALSFAVMDAKVALSDLASCGTCRIRAKLVRHVHWLSMFLLHKPIMPMVVALFKPLPLFHRLVGLYLYLSVLSLSLLSSFLSLC